MNGLRNIITEWLFIFKPDKVVESYVGEKPIEAAMTGQREGSLGTRARLLIQKMSCWFQKPDVLLTQKWPFRCLVKSDDPRVGYVTKVFFKVILEIHNGTTE